MKVAITKESRAWMTLDEHEQAKQIVKDMREDESTAADYVRMAAACWLRNADKSNDCVLNVLTADAEITRNMRAWGNFSDESGMLDIWLNGTVETYDGFLKLGVCLTDVWSIGPDEFDIEFPTHCHARYYTEQK